jgi:hypothetical protein
MKLKVEKDYMSNDKKNSNNYQPFIRLIDYTIRVGFKWYC